MKKLGVIILNIYHSLNLVLDYIEEHLNEKIDYKVLAGMLLTNEYTMQRLFSLLTNMTLTEYIRNRRLSQAGYDLTERNEKIIDVAVKYQYENATSFSRAFEKFYGIKPSELKKSTSGFKEFPKLFFEEVEPTLEPFEYDIIRLPGLTLYGESKKTTKETIQEDAPKFFEEIEQQYLDTYGPAQFGMVSYEDRFESNNLKYWVLYEKEIPGLQRYVIPASRYLSFHIPSQSASAIQKLSHNFYTQFILGCKYKIRELPELEYYHDDVTDFLVPIED